MRSHTGLWLELWLAREGLSSLGVTFGQSHFLQLDILIAGFRDVFRVWGAFDFRFFALAWSFSSARFLFFGAAFAVLGRGSWKPLVDGKSLDYTMHL